MPATQQDSTKTVIVGAGIGGVTLAAALSRRGMACEVYERRPQLSGDGFGLNIQPAAVAVLYRLGLEKKLDETGIRTRAHRYVDHLGAVLFEEARGIDAGFDTPQFSIRRSDLLDLIHSSVESSATFHFGTELAPEQLDRIAPREPASGQAADGLLVGADGLHSVVRRALFPEAMDLNSGDMVLWRGITPVPRLLDGRTMIIANDGTGVRLIAYPVSHAHDQRGQSLVNWVMLVPSSRGGPVDNSNPTQTTDFLLGIIRDWHFDWLDLSALVTHSQGLMRTDLADRQPIDSWSRDRCVLLGDAAHPMFPIGANGATQAIVDAETLATRVCEAPDLDAAIADYERLRIPAVSKIVLANREMNVREQASHALQKNERIQELISTADSYKAKTAVTRPG